MCMCVYIYIHIYLICICVSDKIKISFRLEYFQLFGWPVGIMLSVYLWLGRLVFKTWSSYIRNFNNGT